MIQFTNQARVSKCHETHLGSVSKYLVFSSAAQQQGVSVLLYLYCFRCCQIFGLQGVAGLTQLILEMMIVVVLHTAFLDTFRLSQFQTARSTGSSSQQTLPAI